MAMPVPRTLVSCFSLRPRISRPWKRMEPRTSALLGSSPMLASAVTDVPEPDSPTMPRTSPAASVKSTPRTAWTTPSFVGKSTSRRSTCRRGLGHQARTRLFSGSNASRRPSPTRKMERIRTMRKTDGEHEEPPLRRGRILALVDQQPQRDVGWLDAQPEERERRLEDDAQSDRQRGIDDDRADGVGQQVIDDDAPVGGTERPGGLDEVALSAATGSLPAPAGRRRSTTEGR